jgi:hypothetical protein
MIERIQLGGGSCQITTRVGKGVVVDIRIPLPSRPIVSPDASEPADRRSGSRGEAASG